jgi:hypothetical protein
MGIRFHSLWAINAPLEGARLRHQLERFRTAGFDGVVFHPRFYPNDPPYLGSRYMELVSGAILHAKSLGLSFWIYDEDGWPSGTVGGQLLQQHPEVAQRWVGLVTERPERCLAEFEHAGRRWFLVERTGAGVDYLNPDLAQYFLRLTHERYRTGLAPEAFAHVEAFFCDEPEFGLGHAYDSLPLDGAIPWTSGLPDLYAARHGENLMPHLRDLFFATPDAATTRVRFWELLSDHFCTVFLDPLDAWCRTHGKRFTAHIKGEEHPLFQVPMVGSCSAVFRHIGLPGIDALERFPGNDYYPRQLASVAQQFGDGRCMVEAFGGAGWGATPADLERYLFWLGRHGITDFVMHLSQYRLDSAAIRDWPPSEPLHLSWAEAYPEVLRRVRTELAAHPPAAADTLVISPHRAIMAAYESRELLQTNIHNAAAYPDTPAGRTNRHFLEKIRRLHAAGVAYHVTDEATFEAEARPDAQGTRLGCCVYRHVIAADADWSAPESDRLSGDMGETPMPLRLAAPDGLGVSPVSLSGLSKTEMCPTLSLNWRLHLGLTNSLLLEPQTVAADWFVAEFATEAGFPASELEVVFVDEVLDATCDNRALALTRQDDGTIASLPLHRAAGPHVFRFRSKAGVRNPFAWLRGQFRVLSRTPYCAGPNGTVATRGPFYLASATSPVAAEITRLIETGFPFLREPLVAETTFTLTGTTRSVRLAAVAADAARVTLDEHDLGWLWGPDWTIDADLAVGPHRLRLALYPSTFNHYGPHHYYGGDWHVVSPDQFAGKKNFADPVNAPARTLVSDWHFVPMQLPTSVQTFD